eukprot:3057009-Amphidinium_carterae.1
MSGRVLLPTFVPLEVDRVLHHLVSSVDHLDKTKVLTITARNGAYIRMVSGVLDGCHVIWQLQQTVAHPPSYAHVKSIRVDEFEQMLAAGNPLTFCITAVSATSQCSFAPREWRLGKELHLGAPTCHCPSCHDGRRREVVLC